MYGDRPLGNWPSMVVNNQSIYPLDIDAEIEKLAVQELVLKRMNRQYLLAAGTSRQRGSQTSLPPATQHSSLFRSKLPRSVSPICFSRVTSEHHRTPFLCDHCHQYDFSHFTSSKPRSLLFPSAQHRHSIQRRWRIYGTVLIFYFMLKRNLRSAKRKPTYYQHEYRRIRLFELLTAIHRIYLDPSCSIYQTLSLVVQTSVELLNEKALFDGVQTILDQITNFRPKKGIVGTCSDESILVYLLNCSLEEYPATYFWSIEKHLLTLSYSRMKKRGDGRLDPFTTKFLLLSVFIFRGLIKTLLFKPVKYRLAHGELNSTQSLNLKLLSSLILYVTRHAVIYKEDGHHLPMPFPTEMKDKLMDDARLKAGFLNLADLVKSTAPKLSSWASEYAKELQHHLRARKSRP